MKKSKIILNILIAILVIVAIVLLIFFLLTNKTSGEKKSHPSDVSIPSVDCPDSDLIDYTSQILSYLKKNDYICLAQTAHPEYGVIFSPYATVNLATDLCFMGKQISDFGSNSQKYIWGVYDGVAAPIELTVSEYFARFINDSDYSKCEYYGIDEVLHIGNSLENISDVFPNARYIDCYMPDPNDPENGFEWTSLRLVFEEYDGLLYLTAIIHNEYTV